MASRGLPIHADIAFGSENRRRHREPSRQSSAWTLALVDGGIACSLIAVPFFMGGRTALGQLAFAAVAFWTAVWWTVHQLLGNGDGRWRHTRAAWLMAAAVGLVTLQVVTLSPAIVTALSPNISELLPLWTSANSDQGGQGAWQSLSLTPDVTRQSLSLLLSGVLLFLVVVQRIDRVDDVERVIRLLAISVSLMAAFGILQFLTSNDKFFWFFEHPYVGTDYCVKGAFSNRNHFAQFMALGLGAVMWWSFAARTSNSGRRRGGYEFGRESRGYDLGTYLKALLVPLCILAALMSFSRGGVIALLISGATALFLLLRAGKLSAKAFSVLAGGGLIVCLGLSIYGYESLSNRFQTANSLASLDKRSQLWGAATEGMGDHLLTGTGLSSHQAVYPIYMQRDFDNDTVDFTHAENGYVQTGLETGLTGLGLVLGALAFYFFWCAATLRRELDDRMMLCFVAVLPPLFANAFHSMVDFVWYVPGCMGVVAITGACACRLYQIEREESGAAARVVTPPRFSWGAAAGLLITGAAFVLPGLWATFQAEAPWNRYLVLKHSMAELDADEAYRTTQERTKPRREILIAMERSLAAALAARPDWAEAHACKAVVHLDLFNEYQLTADNMFGLRMIRETSLTDPGLATVSARREWISRAVGEHREHLDSAMQHAHRAVELGPLRGEAYALLAQLAFLEEPPAPNKSEYIAQAYLVRPNHGAILYDYGHEIVLAGGAESAALEYWKKSFRCGLQHQERLLTVLAPYVPADAFIEAFEPDADALRLMAAFHERKGLTAELDVILAAQAAACEQRASEVQGKEASRYWRYASRAHGKLENHVPRMECMKKAVDADSGRFDRRMEFAHACLAAGQFDEAMKQLQWCKRRKSDNAAVDALMERVIRQQYSSTSRARSVEKAALPAGETLR